jgi:hypothetical protein
MTIRSANSQFTSIGRITESTGTGNLILQNQANIEELLNLND